MRDGAIREGAVGKRGKKKKKEEEIALEIPSERENWSFKMDRTLLLDETLAIINQQILSTDSSTRIGNTRIYEDLSLQLWCEVFYGDKKPEFRSVILMM